MKKSKCTGLAKAGRNKGKLKKGYRFKSGKKCPVRSSSGLSARTKPGTGRIVAHVIFGAAVSQFGFETTQDRLIFGAIGGAGGYLWATRSGNGWFSQLD